MQGKVWVARWITCGIMLCLLVFPAAAGALDCHGKVVTAEGELTLEGGFYQIGSFKILIPVQDPAIMAVWRELAGKMGKEVVVTGVCLCEGGGDCDTPWLQLLHMGPEEIDSAPQSDQPEQPGEQLQPDPPTQEESKPAS